MGLGKGLALSATVVARVTAGKFVGHDSISIEPGTEQPKAGDVVRFPGAVGDTDGFKSLMTKV